MLIQKSYWTKDLVDQAFILWNLFDPQYCHDPEDGKENQEQIRREYKVYREEGLLKEGTYLFMVVERLFNKQKFFYNCSDCGFPKFIELEKSNFSRIKAGTENEWENVDDYTSEACPLCGDQH